MAFDHVVDEYLHSFLFDALQIVSDRHIEEEGWLLRHLASHASLQYVEDDPCLEILIECLLKRVFR